MDRRTVHRPGGTGNPDRSNIMSMTLDTTCGIYNTEYTLTKHRDGTRTVRAPYIKWEGNSGCLAHRNIKVNDKHASFIDSCFDQGDGEAAFDLAQRLTYIESTFNR
jgi:hypothetical protein